MPLLGLGCYFPQVTASLPATSEQRLSRAAGSHSLKSTSVTFLFKETKPILMATPERSRRAEGPMIPCCLPEERALSAPTSCAPSRILCAREHTLGASLERIRSELMIGFNKPPQGDSKKIIPCPGPQTAQKRGDVWCVFVGAEIRKSAFRIPTGAQ